MGSRKKVTVIGGGMTGGAIAQRLVEKGIADVVIQDDPQFAGTLHHGKALDMRQSASWLGFDTKITATDGWDETTDSDVVVCTAGAPRGAGDPCTARGVGLRHGNSRLRADVLELRHHDRSRCACRAGAEDERRHGGGRRQREQASSAQQSESS